VSNTIKADRKTAREARKATREAKIKSLGTVEAQLLNNLKDAKAAYILAKAESDAAAAKAQVKFVQAVNSINAPVETSLVCLNCGSVYHKRGECPTCPSES
jgi:hypothetical protein